MHPISFPGAQEIKKPEQMTDEQCSSIPAFISNDPETGLRFFLTAWQPSMEDLNAFNAGRPLYVKTVNIQLPPMLLFTADEEGVINNYHTFTAQQFAYQMDRMRAHAKQCAETCKLSIDHFAAQNKFVNAGEMKTGYRIYTLIYEQISRILSGQSFIAAAPFKSVGKY